jgi:hypothetical protein
MFTKGYIIGLHERSKKWDEKKQSRMARRASRQLVEGVLLMDGLDTEVPG